MNRCTYIILITLLPLFGFGQIGYRKSDTTLVVTEGGQIQKWKTWDYTKSALDKNEERIINKLSELNPLKGKRWVIYGDSFSNDFATDYVGVVRDKLELKATTNAVSGAIILDQLNIAKAQILANPSFYYMYDLATIHIGINDFANNTALGNSSSLTTGNTYAGRLKALIELMLASNPTLKITVITPPEANNAFVTYKGTNSAGYTLAQMSAVISQIADYYGLMCVDLYNTSGINLKTLFTYTNDGLHPNVPTGINHLGNLVASALKVNISRGKSNIDQTGQYMTIPRFNNSGTGFESTPLTFYNSKFGNLPIPLASGHFRAIASGVLSPGNLNNRASLMAAGTTGLYGLSLGSAFNGDSWAQVSRTDGDPTVYNLALQPLGGNVILGDTINNGAKLQVKGKATVSDAPTNPFDIVRKIELDQQSLESVTSGSRKNITSNALQVSGANQMDFTTNSAFTAYDVENKAAGIGNIVDGVYVGNMMIDANGRLSYQNIAGGGSILFSINAMGSFEPAVSIGGRISAESAIEDSELPNLGQVKSNYVNKTAIGDGTILFIDSITTAPASPTDIGKKGAVRYIGTTRYECKATNTWVKTDLAGW